MSAPGTQASLAPIIVALLSLVSLSLLAFVIAFWPQEPAQTPRTRDNAERAAPSSFEDGSFVPAPAKRRQTRWTQVDLGAATSPIPQAA
jgi:hypothetical protein